MFLKISQNSQENACVGVSFSIELQARLTTLVGVSLFIKLEPSDTDVFSEFLGNFQKRLSKEPSW